MASIQWYVMYDCGIIYLSIYYIVAFVGRHFMAALSLQREDKHYYITSLFNPPPNSHSLPLHLSLSVCYPPSTSSLTSPILQFPWWQPRLQLKSFKGGKRGKEMAREGERVIERGSCIQKMILAPEYIFSLPCFLFSLSLPPPPLPPPLPRRSLCLPCFLVCGAPGRSKFNSLMCD